MAVSWMIEYKGKVFSKVEGDLSSVRSQLFRQSAAYLK